MAGVEVKVPDIGDFKDVEVIEVLVKPGDRVEKEQSLITLESDKATMEITSPAAGVVKELKIKTGDKVSQGSPILVLEGATKSLSEIDTGTASDVVALYLHRGAFETVLGDEDRKVA